MLARVHDSISRLKSLGCRSIFILLVFAITSEAPAASSVETIYYPIYGSSYEELNQQMQQKGPQGFFAYTASSIKYKYRTAPAGSGCRIVQVDIDYNLTYTMPKWENANTAPPALRDWWQNFYEALLAHEHNHGHIADQRHSAIQTKFSSLGTRPSCAEFGPLLSQEYSHISQEFSAKQIEYDRLTQHGRTEIPSFYSENQDLGSIQDLDGSLAAFLWENWIWLLLGGTIAIWALRH